MGITIVVSTHIKLRFRSVDPVAHWKFKIITITIIKRKHVYMKKYAQIPNCSHLNWKLKTQLISQVYLKLEFLKDFRFLCTSRSKSPIPPHEFFFEGREMGGFVSFWIFSACFGGLVFFFNSHNWINLFYTLV